MLLAFSLLALSLPASNAVLTLVSASVADAVGFADVASVVSCAEGGFWPAADVSAKLARPFVGSPLVASAPAASEALGTVGAAPAEVLRMSAVATGWVGLAAGCGGCPAVAVAAAAPAGLPSLSGSPAPSLDDGFTDGAG